MNPEFMESVMWAFKSLFDKGLIYEGFRVLPYCWNDETPLSNHELRMDDDVYQDRQDPSVTVGFVFDDTGEDPVLDGAHILVWRSEEHTSELQSLMRIPYAVFCLKKQNKKT